MSDDLRNDIADALWRPKLWQNGGLRLADAILDGGIEVRPGVRIMAVEEVAWYEDVEVNIDTLDRETPLYREATDATSAPQPRNYTPVARTGPQTDLHTTNPQTALRNDPGALRKDSTDG